MATKKTLIGNIKGPKGDPGDKGETGATGAPGTAATINVGTVTTSAYGTTAQVTNSGTETAAVFDFVIPQGKPGEETTRMSALTLDQVTASTETQPIPAVGEVGAVVWGKVIKFFNDIKTAIVNKIAYDDCVANLTSTSSKLPLAANQGKALNNAYTSLNSSLAWKSVGTVTGGQTSITIPAGWKEANVRVGLGGTRYFMTHLVSTNFNFAADTGYNIRNGYYHNSGNNAYVSFWVNTKTTKAATVALAEAYLTGQDLLSTSTIQVQYR